VAERRQSRWLPLVWWLLAGGLAAALKAHFSAAVASELAWMLRPLALLVQLASGWRFTPNAAGEWQSLGAGIVLVKACAGINFMILSFLGWCWMLRPRVVRTTGWVIWLEWPAMLFGALALAWMMALGVNALRILAIVRWQPVLERWLPHDEAHRMLGLLVYLPALSLQLVLAERRRWRMALLAGCALYAALMLVVPLLTGNAMVNPHAYGAHAVRVLAALSPLLVLALWRSSDGTPGVGGGRRTGANAGDRGRDARQSSGSADSTTVWSYYRGGLTPCHRASQQPPCFPMPPVAPSSSRSSPRAPHSPCRQSRGRPPAEAPTP
jgi:exosortase K